MNYRGFLSEHLVADLNMLTDWSEAIALIPATTGSYNTTTGTVTEPAPVLGLRGIIYNVKASRIDGKNILAGDKEVLLYWSDMAMGADPRPDDKLQASNGATYTIKDVRPLATAPAWLLRVEVDAN